MSPKPDLLTECLVLAGRRRGENDPLSGVENASHKAFLRAGGKPLIARVVDALSVSGRIGAIQIAAPEDIRSEIEMSLEGRAGWRFCDPQDSPAATIIAALENNAPSNALLVTTCDHALLSPEMIRLFLDGADTADAAAACVERRIYEMQFPESKRTFINLSDFSFSGANLFWFAGAKAHGLAAFWRRLEQKRKRPLAMAGEIGVATALSYLLGAMSKSRLERTLEKKTGVHAKLIPLPMAEAAIDVDKPQDLALVRNLLGDATTEPAR